MGRLFDELRRRKVVRVTLAYFIVGWGIIEFSNVIEDGLGLPVWTDTLVIVLTALGLPIAIILAWMFDITPKGIKSARETPETRETPKPTVEVTEGAVVGHFAILEQMGKGGMGVVYRALDTKLDRLVALKFLPPELTEDEQASRRFLQEARTAARLDHPHICTIHEIGTLDDGRSFIAMPHYEGRTLDSLRTDRGQLPYGEVAEIGVQVARGLAAAHDSEIVHRDIKPSNLFMTDDGVVKILDFGIAKLAGVDLTSRPGALGTVAYMSPEQVRSQPVDGRTDLWALGVVMYELCSGERPFTGPDVAAVLHGILELAPPPLSELVPDVPAEMSDLVERCLAKDPDQRPTKAAELVAGLSPFSTAAAVPAGVTDATPEPVPDTAELESSLDVEGERRQTTVLVAELAGGSVLEESLSPAESDQLLDACKLAIGEVVKENGGVVNRNTGETLQALFGIPSAHEDDARRAVRAARTLCDRVGDLVASVSSRDGLGLRCGIASGVVVVRSDDTGGQPYRVVGGPAELSVRLAGQAEAGEVLISEDCSRLIASFFDTEEGGELPKRGQSAATRTFRVGDETGVQTRLEAAAEQGLTQLTGRQAELAVLHQACEAVVGGQGGFVSVVGDTGVGKSRLLYEFHHQVDEARFDIVRGRCQSFGSEVPYLPFIDALRDRLGFGDQVSQENADEISDRVRAISPELEDFTPFYRQLLSVGEEEAALQEVAGEQLRVGLVESLSALLTLGSVARPTIVLLEDWHWVDAASRQVLRQLLEMVSAYPLLIVVTARPEGELGWGTPVGHTPIVLRPLAPEDSEVIVRSVLEASEVPTSLTRFLHERTGGNPFFLEEVCQALREDGTLRVEHGEVIVAGSLDHLELPTKVQGVIRTRLDRLDDPTRRLVRYASVVGREFGRDVVARALGDESDITDGLDRLRDLGLIQQIRVVPTLMYRFKHALTQEVAYDGLLERQRAEIHGAVGDAIEALQPDRLNDQLDRLAEHFAQAGRWEKAVEYAIAAADRLWALSEFREASEVQARAMEWVENLEDADVRFEKRVELLLRQERLFEHLGQRDRQQAIIDDLLKMLDPDQHPEHVVATHVRQGDLCILTRDHEGAERALDAAVRLSEEAGDPTLERLALRSMGLLRWHQNRHAEAVPLVERALELDRELGNDEAVVGNLLNLGQLRRAMGRNEDALDYLQQALEVERSIDRKQSGMVPKESFILHVMGSIYSSLGDHESAREHLDVAQDCVRATSSSFDVVQKHFYLTTIARLTLQEGRLDEALELYRESVEHCRKTRHLEGLATSLRLLGDVLLNLERHGEALPILEEAAELYARMHDRASEAPMWRATAVAREALGERQGALEAWEKTRALAVDLGSGALALEAAEGTARLLRSEDPTAALTACQEALALNARGGDVAKTGGIRYTIGILHWELGAYEEALESFETAYEDLIAGDNAADAGLALNSIGRTLRDLSRFDEAKDRLRDSVTLNRENGEKLLEAHALATLGDVHLDLGESSEALERFAAALDLRKSLDDVTGQGWLLLRLAEVQSAVGSAEGIAYYLDEAEEIASRAADLELARRCERLREDSNATKREN